MALQTGLHQHTSLKKQKPASISNTKDSSWANYCSTLRKLSHSFTHNRGQRFILVAHAQMESRAVVSFKEYAQRRDWRSGPNPGTDDEHQHRVSIQRLSSKLGIFQNKLLFLYKSHSSVCVCVVGSGGFSLRRAPVPCLQSKQPPCLSQHFSTVTRGAHAAEEGLQSSGEPYITL